LEALQVNDTPGFAAPQPPPAFSELDRAAMAFAMLHAVLHMAPFFEAVGMQATATSLRELGDRAMTEALGVAWMGGWSPQADA
jgi:hypothetical protein